MGLTVIAPRNPAPFLSQDPTVPHPAICLLCDLLTYSRPTARMRGRKFRFPSFSLIIWLDNVYDVTNMSACASGTQWWRFAFRIACLARVNC